MAGYSYTIRYRREGQEWQEHRFGSGSITLGRDPTCDLCLADASVSRRHARAEARADGCWLSDLGSANRTFLDGKPIRRHQAVLVRPGESFQIGPYQLQIEAEPGRPDGAAHAGSGAKPSSADSQKLGYVIRYRLGESAWLEVPMEHPGLVMGRAPDCDLLLRHETVSRHHARVNRDADGLWLTDLGSTNGTQILGSPIPPRKPRSILPGDAFAVGAFNLLVQTREISEVLQARLAAGAEGGKQETFADAGARTTPVHVRPVSLGSRERIAMGRASDNDVVLDHPMVSRYHAEVLRIGARVQVRDLKSVNGVYVNGERIQQDRWLKDEDELQIGPYGFSVSGTDLRRRAEEGLEIQGSNLNQRISRNLNLLQDICLTVKPMEFVAVVGMSGSGKTTLLNVLNGYRPASDGEVLVNGINLYQNYDLYRNDIGYVPQRDIVHTELTPATALEYVAKLRMPRDTSSQERANAVDEVLASLDLVERRDVPISSLSGGQLKRVSIGVELLTKPRLFFLDEPTSGLDPGTEYEMMHLLRRMSDQGRTVILVTHATKNVALCDKVVFLARGGHLAFFGPPDEALAYFDAYRTSRERRQKEMEFDDIYRILDDERRGTPEEWASRFRSSAAYAALVGPLDGRGTPLEVAAHQLPPSRRAAPPRIAADKRRAQVSALKQFVILSSRNIRILLQDRVSLALMLLLAPAIGLLDFIWGRDLYDPVRGDAAKIVTMWFMTSLITVLVGALSSVREIVKEADIYKRERAVNLRIVPYIMSKVWVGAVLAFYQAAVLLLTRVLFVRPEVSSSAGYLALYVTLFLSTQCGYLIGLVVSASAPNQNAAMLMIIAVLVPQFLFAGALLPLDLIPGGEAISVFMPTRWSFESMMRISGMGDQLLRDPCWALPAGDRERLTDSQKQDCLCLGENLFSRCAGFPGILSPDHYTEEARLMLAQPAPEEPRQPTPFPVPTVLPTPGPLPTPTLLPSPTPLPTPIDSALLAQYMSLVQEQGAAYQDDILGQFEEYRQASEARGAVYSDVRSAQAEEYAALGQRQGEEYRQSMQDYGEARSDYEYERQKAIGSAEALLATIFDSYGRAFRGTVVERWRNLSIIMAGLFVLLVLFQRRKDVV